MLILIHKCFALSCLFIFGLVLTGCSGGGSGGGSAKSSLAASSQSSLSSSLISQASSELTSSSTASLSSSSSNSSFTSSTNSSAVSSIALSSSQSSSQPGQVIISGRITYDFVPAKANGIGLNYAATQALPVRGASVELVDGASAQLASGVTDDDGKYSMAVAANTQVKLRVRAELKSSLSPSWDFSVKDNTSGSSLYVLAGALVTSGVIDSARDLHAASGWDGSAYSAARAAAPFAILDQVYSALGRFQAAGNTKNFPALTFFWSINNRPATGDITQGEIGTSYFDSSSAIYLLGAADSDTDEYDTHVILHEWGHYIEEKFSRADTLGGNHPADARLDMRLALSEGFASAFAGMMLDDPIYTDSSGSGQASGFSFDVSKTNLAVKGWYSEFSVGSILYNFYDQGVGKDFAAIYSALSSSDYVNTPSLTSIYSLTTALGIAAPAAAATLSSLLEGQHIFGRGIYGEGESNGALKSTIILPVVAPLTFGSSSKRCSTNAFFTATATDNTLGVYSFARFSLSTSAKVSISATKNSATTSTTDPDLYLYKQGRLIEFSEKSAADVETFTTQTLAAGDYLVILVDDKNINSSVGNGDSCFDLVVQQN